MAKSSTRKTANGDSAEDPPQVSKSDIASVLGIGSIVAMAANPLFLAAGVGVAVGAGVMYWATKKADEKVEASESREKEEAVGGGLMADKAERIQRLLRNQEVMNRLRAARWEEEEMRGLGIKLEAEGSEESEPEAERKHRKKSVIKTPQDSDEEA